MSISNDKPRVKQCKNYQWLKILLVVEWRGGITFLERPSDALPTNLTERENKCHWLHNKLGRLNKNYFFVLG